MAMLRRTYIFMCFAGPLCICLPGCPPPPPNLAPVADDQLVSVAFDTPTAITLTASDPDSGPQTLAYSIVSQPQHGTLTGTPPSVTYTPDTGYSGPDSFTFKANDGEADSDPLTVSITVQAAGGGPGATFTDGDGYPELTGSPLISPVIANGPYSSMEKNAWSGGRFARISLTALSLVS